MWVVVCSVVKNFDADAVEGVDEAFVGIPVRDIGRDQALDHGGHFGGGKGAADHFADAGIVALTPAERDLVPLFAVLIDAENADGAEVMMAAGVHAPGDVEFQFANVVLIIQILETLLDRGSDWQ